MTTDKIGYKFATITDNSITHNEPCESHVEGGGARGRVLGVVDVVRHIHGKQPVVAAVLEQVHERHRAVGEPVHEQGLQDALHIVSRETHSRHTENIFRIVRFL